ncbi:MAG: carboxypeptidase-like regulatory domain-containing protein [Alphaproteobacteria bacterium]|jgi:hypothetical protein|nr:carboxypeptidase-like regulatory domain-containing protein [Alphaproteobacteria bacterium]
MMILRTLFLAGSLAALAAAATAGTISGTVNDTDGNALNGAMVRVNDTTSGISQTVFSNSDGAFTLTTDL